MELGIQLPPGIAPVSVRSFEEYEQIRCDFMNQEKGRLPGEHCEVCLDKGLIYFLRNGEIVCKPCACMARREAMERLHKSGLDGMLDEYTFESFKAAESWQKEAKEAAMQYAESPDGWLLVCGQVGSGKTHLCTAAVGKLMKAGRSARYMLWRDEAVKLKAAVNDEAAYARLIQPLKEADVLYIDDLFKTATGVSPTPGDVNLAFELINARYCRKGSITVFSSELTVDDLIRIDEAVGSRIYQRTKGHCIVIGRSLERNYRLRKEKA